MKVFYTSYNSFNFIHWQQLGVNYNTIFNDCHWSKKKVFGTYLLILMNEDIFCWMICDFSYYKSTNSEEEDF